MAYGRLDVFWPDGLFRSFALVENNISVGRSTGNTIALETTTISRYHFTLTYDGEQVFITDVESANGTFVDGVKLNHNEPRLLQGGEEIQAGHLRIIYHRLDETPTQPMAALDDTTQRIELELPAFRLDVISPEQPFSPGAHMTAELAITNTSDSSQRYQVQASGMPPEWIRIDRSELVVEPNATAPALINFKPLRRWDSRPGDYPVTVQVWVKDDPETKLEAHFTARVLPFSGFGMAMEAPRITSGERFRLHLHNQGSAPLTLTISGRDRGDLLRFSLLTPEVTLAPGQRLSVQGEIKPKNPAWLGKPRQYPFDLVVRSNDPSHFLAAVRGQFIERPMLPSWSPFLLLLGLIPLAVLVVLGAVLLFGPRPQPQILAFQVNTTQVAQGTPLVVSWSATDVQTFSLNLNGTPIVENISGSTNGLNLDTSQLSGSIDLALIGVNGGQQASAVQTVYIYEPLGEGVFTAEPAQLVRYVVQNLTVSWDVPGAVTTRISGLETFTQTPIETTYGPEATISNLAGIPTGPITLTLFAEDEAGNQQQQTLQIPAINPECVPAGSAVTLYAGPDTRHQVVGTVSAGAIVVVDAQDSSGRWLRAQLPGGVHGWGQAAELSCANNFNVADLYKELTVPTLPPVTAAPVGTATPAPTRTPRPTRAPVVPNTPRPTPTPSG